MNAAERVATDLVEFAKLTGNTIFVSDGISSDAELYDELTDIYRRGLEEIDRALAKICERVIEVNYTNITDYQEW